MSDRWRPSGADNVWTEDLTEGMVIGIDHDDYRFRPWRIIHTRLCDDGGMSLVVRPTDPAHDLAEFQRPIKVNPRKLIPVFRDHYPVCSQCGDLQPCREQWVQRITDAAVERAARYEVAGICPACEEPVTHRQGAHRFPENLHVPLGPPVVFHARQKCLSGAIEYDRRVAESTGREPRLSCTGHLTRHRDGIDECTNPACPGAQVSHRSWAACVHLSGCDRDECWSTVEAVGGG